MHKYIFQFIFITLFGCTSSDGPWRPIRPAPIDGLYIRTQERNIWGIIPVPGGDIRDQLGVMKDGKIEPFSEDAWGRLQ